MAGGTGGEAWQGWLNRHGPGMLLLARQWVTGRADAEDVVQEAFLRFWRARERGDRTIATQPIEDPVAYLFACVNRAAMDWQRGGRRRGVRENSVAAARFEASSDAAMLSGPLEREERRAAVEAALARLPEPQREVLVLKVWAGLSFPQIGQALGVPPDTAASRYRYGLAKLREQLAEELIP
jgi:RNA polymerase sigma-70 factor, ECF subfamily